MEITEEQYQRVDHLFPIARGGVKLTNLAVLNAALYPAEQGCKGRALPERFGPWHTVYMRWQRRNEQGLLARVFAELPELGLPAAACACWAWTVPASRRIPMRRGRRKKGPQVLGQSHGGRSAKGPGMAADDGAALMVTLSPGPAHDGVEGRKLLTLRGPQEPPAYLLMARAYAGAATRQLARDLGYWPVAPPRRHRKVKWE